MKKIKFILAFLLFSIGMLAQTNPYILPRDAVNQVSKYKGGVILDSLMKLPVRGHEVLYPDVAMQGRLQFNRQDSLVEVHNGTNWVPLRNYISPYEFSGTDTERIQKAFDKGSLTGKPVYIPSKPDNEDNVWFVDEALKPSSNTTIFIQDTKLKLSDTSRDNLVRTPNCGIGITNPQDNPIENISIIGIGDAVIEGADNPRATGDSGKTLSLTSNILTGSLSYGTDAGVPSEKQTGDWRNIGFLFGYTNNLEIKGLSFVNMHCYAISMEHCTRMNIDNIYINCPAQRVYNGNNRTTKNNDGINVRFGGSDFSITNVYGITGDDAVAMTTTTLATQPAGSLFTTNVTGNMVHEPIENGYINNIQTDTYFNNVRVFNTLGSIIRNITITNIIDTATSDTNGAAILFGDNNAIYGGPTAIGECSNITVNNVVAKKKRWCIRVLGSISESHISNLYYDELPSLPNVPIFFDEDSDGARQLTVDNVIYNGVETEMSTTRDGATGERTGLINDAINGLTFTHRVKGVDAVDDEDLVTLQQLEAATITVDTIPTDGSTNAVSSNGTFDALALKANDSGVVHNSGNETIGGTKTFSSSTTFSSGFTITGGGANNYINGAGTATNFGTSARGTVLSTFSAAAGTVTSSDNIASAFNKLAGNQDLKANLSNPTFTTNITTPAITVSSTPTSSAGSYDIVTRNSSTGVIEKIASNTFAPLTTPIFTGAVKALEYYTKNGTDEWLIADSNGEVYSEINLNIHNFLTDFTGTIEFPTGNTNDRNYELPDASGTLALTSNIPTILSGSNTLDFPDTATGTSAELTITVTGAADGDVVSVGVPNGSSNANSCFTARVSATDTVTVKFNNYSGGNIDPASGTFKVKVFK